MSTLTLEIRGPELTPAERAQRARARADRRRHDVAAGARDRIAGPVPYEQVPALSTTSTRSSSARRSRAAARRFDKVLCEACGVRPSGRRQQPDLAGRSRRPAARAALSRRATRWLWRSVLSELAAAEPATRAAAGAELRRRVVAGHSVDSWADAVAAAVARLPRVSFRRGDAALRAGELGPASATCAPSRAVPPPAGGRCERARPARLADRSALRRSTRSAWRSGSTRARTAQRRLRRPDPLEPALGGRGPPSGCRS